MFGHQDDDKDHNNDAAQEDTAAAAADQPQDETINADGGHDDRGSDQTASDDGGDASADESTDAGDQSEAQPIDDAHAWQHPGEPLEHEDDGPEQINDIIGPVGQPQAPTPPMPINARDLSDDDGKTPHELIDIKQKALNELTPLLGELDLPPEDKFRTLLMIIQASDNQDMIKQAYDAAEDIKDEKVRAQALLDLVNEINYFTQHPAA